MRHLNYWCYVGGHKTLTPSPSHLLGEGNKKLVLLPLALNGRAGLGGEGDIPYT